MFWRLRVSIITSLMIFDASIFGQDAAQKLARGTIRAAAGPAIYSLWPYARQGINAKIKTTLGLLVEGGLDPTGALEIAVFPVEQEIRLTTGADSFVIYSAHRLNITTSYRYYIMPSFSIALGLKSSYSMGDLHRVGNRGEEHRSIDKNLVNQPTRYLLDLSVQLSLWQRVKNSLILDVRYAKYFANPSLVAADQLTIFLAVRYQIPKPTR